MKSYMASRNGVGIMRRICNSFQYQGSLFITLSAASDFLYTFPLSISTNESNSADGKSSRCNSFCPASDCRAANLKIPFLSYFNTRLTDPLQKLHTPSKRIIGFSFTSQRYSDVGSPLRIESIAWESSIAHLLFT